MLWMAVVAVYLGVLRESGVPASAIVFFGLWLGIVVVVRCTLGTDPGFLVTVCVSGCYFAVALAVLECLHSGWGYLLMLFMFGLVGGPPLGAIMFLPVSAVVWAVDEVDVLLQTKTPPATDNQPQRPDAPSTEE